MLVRGSANLEICEEAVWFIQGDSCRPRGLHDAGFDLLTNGKSRGLKLWAMADLTCWSPFSSFILYVTL